MILKQELLQWSTIITILLSERIDQITVELFVTHKKISDVKTKNKT